MKLSQLTPLEALDFYFLQADLHDDFMVVAAAWRLNPEPGEEDWFEELTADEFEQEKEEYLEQFKNAAFQIWSRRTGE